MPPLTDDDEPLPGCVQFGLLRLEAAPGGDDDFDPAEVTRLIGIEPGWSKRLGDPRRPGTDPVSDVASWRILAPRREELHTEVLVRELLDIVEPHAAGLAEARRRFGLSAGIHIVIDVYQTLASPHVLLRPETLRRLAALDLWLYCEQDILI